MGMLRTRDREAPAAGERSDAAEADARTKTRGQPPSVTSRPPFRLRVDPLPALALGAGLLLLWLALTATGSISPFLLPPPVTVAQAFVRGLGRFAPEQIALGGLAVTIPLYQPGLLVTYGLTTLLESVLGFALGTAVALPLGYALARNRLLARALQPYLAASQAMPAVALAPLLMIWLGFGLLPVVVLCALIVFFPTVITTALGLRLLDRDVLDAARVDGADRWALLARVELPLALPSILAGVRTSLTLSITGAVVGEFVASDQGLGGLLSIARAQFDTPLVFATLVMLALLAALAYGAPRLVERRFSYLEAE